MSSDLKGERKTWIFITAAVAVLALVAVGLLVALDGSDDESSDIVDDPTTTTMVDDSTTATGAPNPSTTVPVAPADSELPGGEPLGADQSVAIITIPPSDTSNELGELAVVVLDSRGETLRTIADGFSGVEGGIYGLTLTPDRQTVLFASAGAACLSSLRAAPVDGSSNVVTVADGNYSAVSPDGTLLAFQEGDQCANNDEIVVRGVNGTSPRTYSGFLPGDPPMITGMAFANQDTIVITAVVDDTTGLLLLDLASGEATRIEPGRDGTAYSSPTLRSTGAVTVFTVCCGRDPSDGAINILDGAEFSAARDISLVGTQPSTGPFPTVTGVLRADDTTLVVDGGLRVGGERVRDDITYVIG